MAKLSLGGKRPWPGKKWTAIIEFEDGIWWLRSALGDMHMDTYMFRTKEAALRYCKKKRINEVKEI